MLVKISYCLTVLLMCLYAHGYAVDPGGNETSESLAIRLSKEASLTEESSGAAMIKFGIARIKAKSCTA